ncbi:MAG: ComF family protein [Pseudomonadota bacterium]
MPLESQIFEKPRLFFTQLLEREGARAARAGKAALDFVLPPRCASCGALTERQVGLCAQCWPDLTFITQPFCDRCGTPFEFDIPGTSLCAACLRRPPAYDKAFSPLVYEAMARSLILQFKHGDRLGHARLLGTLMAGQIMQFGLENPLIVPIPLHRRRLMRRRFNQSALLARVISKQIEAQLDLFTLVRVRATPMQQGLNSNQRRENVRAAFGLRRGREGFVKGRNIILVDDVLTTGATAEACCKPLRKAGAARICVLTAARVAGPQTAII